MQQGGKVRRKSIDTEGGKGLIRHSRATRRKRMEPAKQSKKIKEESGKVLLCANVECTKFMCEVNEHTIPAHASYFCKRLLSSSESRRTAKSRPLNAENVAFTCAPSVLLPLCLRSCLVFFFLLWLEVHCSYKCTLIPRDLRAMSRSGGMLTLNRFLEAS